MSTIILRNLRTGSIGFSDGKRHIRCFRRLIACGIAAVFAVTAEFASAQSSSAKPDLDLAYVLATAAFCAYAVGTANGNDDFGKSTAAGCLHRAAQLSAPLQELDVGPENVEAYVGPDGKDAYLMLQTGRGLIIAFRGTLPPPVYGGSGPGDGLIDRQMQFAKEFVTFFSDWTNNANIIDSSGDGRHPGFRDSWKVLRDHLGARCDGRAGGEPCSRFHELWNNAVAGRRLFLTGHSKGGALATLATVDIKSGVLGEALGDVTTYTFAAPKAFAPKAMAAETWMSVMEKTKSLWRFEYKYDIVPLLPPEFNASLVPLKGAYNVIYSMIQKVNPGMFPSAIPEPLSRLVYAAVGNLAFIDRDGNLGFSGAGDANRLQEFIGTVLEQGFSVKGICRVAVYQHFRVMVDVQTVATARERGELRGSAPYRIDQTNWENSFFAQGLSDDGREVMWGFKSKCEW